VDPRLLLGVGARATRATVRAAHRRLRDAVDPRAGGTDGLVRIVDAAYAVLTTGRGAEGLAVDPHAVLGVPATADVADVRAAYRRVSLVAHPDRGGTDELFRVVATAYEVLTGTAPRRRLRGQRPPSSPPPPPPPRGPYRAPDPSTRHHVSRWRAVRDLLEHGSPLLLALVLVATAFELAPGVGVVVVVIFLIWFGSILRPSIDGFLRAAVVLRGSRVRVKPEVEPERFLEDACLDAPVARQREDDLYDAYVRWCRGRGDAVAPWVFVERLRGLGLLFVKSSAWDSGLWVGVELRR
jgi:hypothetical protein